MVGEERILMNVRFYSFARKYYAQIKNAHLGQESKVCVSDISGDSIKDIKTRAYIDHGHLLGVGNQAVAEIIVRRLDGCGVLPWNKPR